MLTKVFTLINAFLLITILSFTQCINRDSLWRKLWSIYGSGNTANSEKLMVLLNEEDTLRNCSIRNDSVNALLFRMIGMMYFKKSDFLKSLQYYHEAINIITGNAGKPSVNSKHLIAGYYWLSVFYDSLNNINEKQRAIDSCISIAMRLNAVDISCIRSMYARVEYLFEVGDYYRCIDYAKNCERFAKEYADANVGANRELGESIVASSLKWTVNAHLLLKNYDMARKLLIDKIEECKRNGLTSTLGQLYAQFAQVELQNENYQTALFYFNEAFLYERKSGNNINCKIILNSIGYNIYFLHLKNYNKALVYYRDALHFNAYEPSQGSIDAFESLSVLTNIAQVFVERKNFDSAFFYFQLAFDQISPGIAESELLHISRDKLIQTENYYIVDLLMSKANALQQQFQITKQIKHLANAIRVYKITDSLLDRFKVEQTDLKSKLFWRNDSKRLYEHAIEACFIDNNVSDAFYFFERSRAVLLNDQLKELHLFSEPDIMEQTQVKKRIVQLENELKEADVGSKHYVAIQTEILSQKLEMDRLLQTIKNRNPFYYQSFLNQDLITIPELQHSILKDYKALIEIFSGDSNVYVLTIYKDKVSCSKTDKFNFEKISGKYISYLSDFGLINKNYKDFIRTSRDLFKVIFDTTSVFGGRIIISPDGRYFPFESLVVNSDSSNPKYFLQEHAVSYTYSARYLLNEFSENVNSNAGNFMGVAPVAYASGFSLGSLLGSDQSLKQIGFYFNKPNMLIASQATKNNFLQQYAKYQIVQLYTHAADSGKNGEPVIHFVDSALYLSDLIAESKPLTRLIVLSACETGNGKLYQGEGVFSFNRGFASLGIPCSIINLWSVDNQSTYRITELFYKYLSGGMPVDVALQKAKLEFIQSSSANRLPFYWAAAIVAGKTDKFELTKPFSWFWFGLIGVGLTGILVFMVRYWLRNR